MSVLIDADVILEWIFKRGDEQLAGYIEKLFDNLACEFIKGYITDIGFKNIIYCCCEKSGKYTGAEIGCIIEAIETLISEYPVNADLIDKALEFKKFSSVNLKSAIEIACVTNDNLLDAIITLTPELFSGATVPVLEIKDLFDRVLLEKVWGGNIEPTINMANWLQGILDADWELAPIRLTSLRSSVVSHLNSHIAILENNGICIPSGTIGAYKDLTLGNNTLRLYAVAWKLCDVEEGFEWTLLIILAPKPRTYLNESVSLKISDENQALAEKILEKYSGNYISAQVLGALNEQFVVNISTFDDLRITLPSFCFKEYS